MKFFEQIIGLCFAGLFVASMVNFFDEGFKLLPEWFGLFGFRLNIAIIILIVFSKRLLNLYKYDLYNEEIAELISSCILACFPVVFCVFFEPLLDQSDFKFIQIVCIVCIFGSTLPLFFTHKLRKYFGEDATI